MIGNGIALAMIPTGQAQNWLHQDPDLTTILNFGNSIPISLINERIFSERRSSMGFDKQDWNDQG